MLTDVKFQLYSVTDNRFEQATEKYNPKHIQWATYPGLSKPWKNPMVSSMEAGLCIQIRIYTVIVILKYSSGNALKYQEDINFQNFSDEAWLFRVHEI